MSERRNEWSTFGSVNKLAGCIEAALLEHGFDPTYAHRFTIACASLDKDHPRILIVIEPRKP